MFNLGDGLPHTTVFRRRLLPRACWCPCDPPPGLTDQFSLTYSSQPTPNGPISSLGALSSIITSSERFQS